MAAADTTVTQAMTGLSEETDYIVYVAAEDAASPANRMDAVGQKAFTTLDETPPVFFTGGPVFPSISDNTGTGLDVDVQIDEDGTCYAVAVARDAAQPSAAEVQAGTGAGGSGEIAAASAAAGTSSSTIALTGLSIETEYDIWVACEDDASSPNRQAAATLLQEETIDNVDPSFATDYPQVDNIAGTTADLLVDLDEPGQFWYCVLPATATQPSAYEQPAE